MSQAKEIKDVYDQMLYDISKQTQYHLNVDGVELVHLQLGLKAIKEKYRGGLSDKEWQELRQLQEKLETAEFV